MQHLRVGRLPEQFGREMVRGPDACGTKRHFLWIGFCIGHQFLHGFRLDLGSDQEHVGVLHHRANQREVLARIKKFAALNDRCDRHARTGNKIQRVAVRRRFCGLISCDHAARSGAVLDHDSLFKLFAQVFGKRARR